MRIRLYIEDQRTAAVWIEHMWGSVVISVGLVHLWNHTGSYLDNFPILIRKYFHKRVRSEWRYILT